MKLDNSLTSPITKTTRKRSLLAAFGLAASLLVSALAPAMPAQAATSAAPANAPAAYTCLYYTVKRGDQLLRIAIRYGTTTEILMRVNGMRSNRVYIGQRLCIPRATPPPGPKPPPGPGPQPGSGPWYGEYWNNTAQSGAPSLVRNDVALNFNWGYSTPDASRVFADNFSARWTRTFTSNGGVYRFTVTHDDGVRLYVDGNLVLNQYDFVGNATNTVDVAVAAGSRVIRLDYVEKSGIALVRLNYYPVTAPLPPAPPVGGAWRADFYNNRDLAGAPVYVASYNALNFSWGTSSPGGSVPADNWSARFTQLRTFNAGTYRFIASSDDGVRVYVDDVLVVNNWREQSYATASGDITLSAGNHYIRVDYFDAGAQAALSLYIDQR